MFGPDVIDTLVADHRRKLVDLATEERLSGRAGLLRAVRLRAGGRRHTTRLVPERQPGHGLLRAQ